MELGIKEGREHKEVQLYWMTGTTNPANLFTKEDNDVKHFETLQDQMVTSQKEFGTPSPSNKNNI